MKKQFLTLAILATVAVGGAFAGGAKVNSSSIDQGSPFNENGDCETPTAVSPFQTCEITPSLIQCTLQIGGNAYIYNPETESCTTPLYRQ